jgi:hypothetical protein
MKQEEERLEKEIDELMQQAEVVDAEEDKAFGAAHNGYNLPEELHGEKIGWRKYAHLGSNLSEKRARNNTSRKVKPRS